MTRAPDLGLLRLAALRLAGPGPDTAAGAVGWLTAAQAQDHAGVLTSVALRTARGTRTDVEAALDAGEIVKSWPLRGTLHLTAAGDLPWMVDLVAPRILAGAAPRRARLDLDEPTLERAREVAVAALAGGGELTRDDLLARWRGAGVVVDGQCGYHILFHLALTGTLCFGPVRGGPQRIVLVEEWIPRPRRLDREQAAGELALRYFRGHGPATVADFTRWAGLAAAEVRAGVAIARGDLDRLEVDGVEYLMDPGTPDRLLTALPRAAGLFLLPGFDEFILGYRDRGAVLPARYADRIVPGGNGMFRPTIIHGAGWSAPGGTPVAARNGRFPRPRSTASPPACRRRSRRRTPPCRDPGVPAGPAGTPQPWAEPWTRAS